MSSIKVALLGFGTIGTGVAKILLEDAPRIEAAIGKKVELVAVCDKNLTSRRDIELPPGVLTDDASRIFNDPEISLVFELIGGLEPARTFVLKALESGKSVVTANKALLASHGQELYEAAKKNNRTIAFEAAVCGGIPILTAVATSLQANRFESLQAIVNGTSNFILSQMSSEKTDYEDAVKEAQRLGYAEANPAMDVDGTDAVQKLSILAHLAFGAGVDWKSIPRTGIENVKAVDIYHAGELGYRIKLLAVAEADENELELHVTPTLVRKHSLLAETRDAFNGVRIVGNSVGPLFFQGYGAGCLPTASAVVGDMIDTLLGRTAITFDSLQYWRENRSGLKMKNPDDIIGKSYIRCFVEDRPGVMGELAGIFGENGISLASIIQHGTNNGNKTNYVPIIFMTHEAKEKNLLKAIEEIDALPCTQGQTVRMRVRD